jgi:hypothetical protein
MQYVTCAFTTKLIRACFKFNEHTEHQKINTGEKRAMAVSREGVADNHPATTGTMDPAPAIWPATRTPTVPANQHRYAPLC